MSTPEVANDVAHIVQVALTPVFLLSGIGTLLNVFNTRISRVSDHVGHLTEMLEEGTGSATQQARAVAHLPRLETRRLILDIAIVLVATGGASTCGAAFVLFMAGVRGVDTAHGLEALFGIALACTVCALLAFVGDSVLAWHGIRRNGPIPRPKTATN